MKEKIYKIDGAFSTQREDMVCLLDAAKHYSSPDWFRQYAAQIWDVMSEDERAAAARRLNALFQKQLDASLAPVVRGVLAERIGAMVDDALTARLGQVGAEVEKQTSERLEKEIRAVVDERIKAALAHVKRSL